jgi:hypothetical protein
MLAPGMNEHHVGIPAAEHVPKPPRTAEPEPRARERSDFEGRDILFWSDRIVTANSRCDRRHSRRLLLHARMRLGEERYVVSARGETTRCNCKCA